MLTGLRAFCLADAALVGLVSDQVFVGDNPREGDKVYPFVEIIAISQTGQYTAQAAATRQARVQFNAVGPVGKCFAITDRLRLVLDTFTGLFPDGTRIINLQEDSLFGPTRMPDLRDVHKLSQDFLVKYAENLS